LVLSSVIVFGFGQLCHVGHASAQTLNQQVDQLLQNNCAALGIGNNAAQLGINLQNVCGLNGPQVGAGASSTGGGAGSVQGSAASILNRALLKRLDETDEEEGRDHKRSSSMRFNPFSSLLAGIGRASSVSSPFYAATSGDGTSSAAFSTSSQSRW